MPPKSVVSKEKILQAAFTITKRHGFEAVNARSVAKELGCSTHPIFREYDNMQDLKKDLLQYVESYYNQYVEKRMSGETPFLSIGLAYIEFAKSESNLFRMIFMSHNFELHDFVELIDGEENKTVILGIARAANVDEEKAKDLYLKVWLFTHGIASMLSTNTIHLSDEHIEKLLKDAFQAFRKMGD